MCVNISLPFTNVFIIVFLCFSQNVKANFRICDAYLKYYFNLSFPNRSLVAIPKYGDDDHAERKVVHLFPT